MIIIAMILKVLMIMIIIEMMIILCSQSNYNLKHKYTTETGSYCQRSLAPSSEIKQNHVINTYIYEMQITIDSLPRVLREGPVLPLWMSNSLSELGTIFQEWLQMISM